jgi:hypothetical protein
MGIETCDRLVQVSRHRPKDADQLAMALDMIAASPALQAEGVGTGNAGTTAGRTCARHRFGHGRGRASLRRDLWIQEEGAAELGDALQRGFVEAGQRGEFHRSLTMYGVAAVKK